MSLNDIRIDLRKIADLEKAKLLQRYFKTGKGEYAEGDVFLGISVPEVRKVGMKHKSITLKETEKLLKSKIHEERFIALEILVMKFDSGNEKEKKEIYDFYLKNTKSINNWDLVDTSALYIIGKYLIGKKREVLYKLAKSKNLWERRISIISTAAFIVNKDFDDTFKISKILLTDKEDLIHKAVGWMLREVGKRDLKAEETFLNKYYTNMPRTMLRYAIEKFPEAKRKDYLKGKI